MSEVFRKRELERVFVSSVPRAAAVSGHASCENSIQGLRKSLSILTVATAVQLLLLWLPTPSLLWSWSLEQQPSAYQQVSLLKADARRPLWYLDSRGYQRRASRQPARLVAGGAESLQSVHVCHANLRSGLFKSTHITVERSGDSLCLVSSSLLSCSHCRPMLSAGPSIHAIYLPRI